jgi:hypothetical protein
MELLFRFAGSLVGLVIAIKVLSWPFKFLPPIVFHLVQLALLIYGVPRAWGSKFRLLNFGESSLLRSQL